MKTSGFPDPRSFGSLIELLDDAAERYPADQPVLRLRTDDGISDAWSARNYDVVPTVAAWRFRAAGLTAGERILVWSVSTPSLPAVYWGAMLAGLVFVPLDVRMTRAVLRQIADQSGSSAIAVGGGPDAPDVKRGGLDHLRQFVVEELVAEPIDWRPRVPARLASAAGTCGRGPIGMRLSRWSTRPAPPVGPRA